MPGKGRRPRVGERVGIERHRLLAGLRGTLEKVARELGNILRSLAKRGQHDPHLGQTEVEVFPESTGLDFEPKIAVRSGDHAHVDRHDLLATHARQLALLEHPQKLRLQREWKLADFVDEKRAAVGSLERSLVARVGTSESASLVSEEHRLGERFGNGGRVENGEGAFGARAARMHGARDFLFARSSVTLHQQLRGFDETRSSTAKSSRMAAVLPSRPSNRPTGAAWAGVTPTSASRRSSVSPTRTIAPGASSTSSTR